MRRRTNRTSAYVTAGGVVIALASLVALWLANPTEVVDRRHCFVDGRTNKTLVIELDPSDPLVAIQPRAIGFEVEQELATLNEGDRILVLDAAGRPAAEVQPVVDQCVPGDDDNIARNAFKREVIGPIEAHLRALKTQVASAQSPLAETILSVVADASLHGPHSQVIVVLATDALQNTDYYSAYRKGSAWPNPEGVPLKGVAVHLFLVKNERDFALQPRAAQRFAAWLRRAGASVSYRAPAWLMLADAGKKRGRR